MLVNCGAPSDLMSTQKAMRAQLCLYKLTHRGHTMTAGGVQVEVRYYTGDYVRVGEFVFRHYLDFFLRFCRTACLGYHGFQAITPQTSTHSSIMDLGATSKLPRQHLAPPPLPSGLDIHVETHIELDTDLVQGSIRSGLQSVCAPSPQRPAWSLYRALAEAQRQMATGTAAEGSPDPQVYAQTMRRCMQEAHQRPPVGVVTQGRTPKTRSWMEFTETQHAKEALDHIQELDDRQQRHTKRERHASSWRCIAGRGTTPLPFRTKRICLMHAPQLAKRPPRPRVRSAWTGRPHRRMTNTPWYTGYATGLP